MEHWLERGLPGWFEVNLLPVTKAIADQWARFTIQAKKKGIPVTTADGLIAATAIAHDLTIATRDVKDFALLAVPVINPWEAANAQQ